MRKDYYRLHNIYSAMYIKLVYMHLIVLLFHIAILHYHSVSRFFFFIANDCGGGKSAFYSENHTAFSSAETLAILLLYLNCSKLLIFERPIKWQNTFKHFRRPSPSPNSPFSLLYQQFHCLVWVLADMPPGISSCWRFWPLLIQVCAIFTTDLSKMTPCHTKILQGAFWNSS